MSYLTRVIIVIPTAVQMSKTTPAALHVSACNNFTDPNCTQFHKKRNSHVTTHDYLSQCHSSHAQSHALRESPQLHPSAHSPPRARSSSKSSSVDLRWTPTRKTHRRIRLQSPPQTVARALFRQTASPAPRPTSTRAVPTILRSSPISRRSRQGVRGLGEARRLRAGRRGGMRLVRLARRTSPGSKMMC
jgi:hypothetical protein